MKTTDTLERKRRARERAIDGLLAQARHAGGCVDRMYWTLVWDLEMAPMTTNLEQLAEVGFVPVPPDDVCEGEMKDVLDDLISELARLGVYLTHTDHLIDRDLYDILVTRVLREPVRDLPPSPDVVEWIDLAVGALPTGEDVYLTFYATDAERRAAAPTGSRKRLPARRARVVERDRWLPRPENFSGEPESGFPDQHEPF